MDWVLLILAELLLVPFVGWGVYLLRLRYHLREELALPIEVATLLGVGLFVTFEIYLLWGSIRDETTVYLFSVLGLFIAALALYGHVAISVLSRVIVDILTPAEHNPSDRPRTGPAEALERMHDYAGALAEYRVLARIYPQDPEIPWRVAENLVRLEERAEAVQWYERSMRLRGSAESALPVLNRLCDLLAGPLQDPATAVVMLERFANKYGSAPEAALARSRAEHIGARVTECAPASLDALAGLDLAVDAAEEEEPASRAGTTLGLDLLDDAPIDDDDADEDIGGPRGGGLSL